MFTQLVSQKLEELMELINSSNPSYGLVDDLDLTKYDNDQLFQISLGRGDNFEFGNVDDLDPSTYDGDKMHWVSIGRGTNPDYGNIDDLDPEKYNKLQMFKSAKIRSVMGDDGNF